MTQSHIVVVGGGLAGMAAAELISRIAPSIKLTLLESKRILGGRAGSYFDPETASEVDYCQHAAMGCCTNLIDMLQRCGLDQHFRRYQKLTFLHPDHPPSHFAPNRFLPPPLHLLGAIGAQRYLSGRQKREIKSGLWKLMRTTTSTLGDVRAAQWLAHAGQRHDTVRDFWDVILVSALGEQTDRVSMAAARKVFIDGFANTRGASDVLVPTLPLADLFGRLLAKVLVDRNVDVRTGQSVRQISPDSNVVTTSEQLNADAVIAAIPWHQISRLFDQWPDAQLTKLPKFETFSKIPSSPITGLHLWFDRPITDLDHAVMVGTVSQWLFRDPCRRSSAYDSPEATGSESARPNTSSISPPSTDAPEQHYYQVVISGSVDATSIEKQSLVDTVLAELRHAFPAAGDAKLLRHRVITDPKSVFSIRPEVDAIRPAAETGLPWLYLAGDWTNTGWPATMEGAVISGRAAATAALQQLLATPNEKSPGIPNEICSGTRPGIVARWLIRQC